MKDSGRVQEKCQTVSQRGGGAASSSSPGIKIPDRAWHRSQGARPPSPGPRRKEKRFPGAGSDRNTTPPGAPEPGPESERAGFFRDLPGPREPDRLPANARRGGRPGARGAQLPPPPDSPRPSTRSGQPLRVQERAPRPGHQTSQGDCGGREGVGFRGRGHLRASEVTPIPPCASAVPRPQPPPHASIGGRREGGHLQQPPPNSKNLRHVSFNLSLPPRWEALKHYFLGEGEGTSGHWGPPV